MIPYFMDSKSRAYYYYITLNSLKLDMKTTMQLQLNLPPAF